MTKRKEPKDEKGDLTLEFRDDIRSDMDPKLQALVRAAESGGDVDPSIASESEDGSLVIDVIAKLKDPSRQVPGLNVIRTMGDIVTGTLDADSVEAVRGNSNVISLKAATRLESHLEFSVPEMEASQSQINNALPIGTEVVDGSGVIVGVVDYGCDFMHPNFRNSDGSTRLLFLWDQRSGSNPMSPSGFPYGRELAGDLLNSAIKAARSGGGENRMLAYQHIGYRPEAASHGTHVMDTAAGNGRATGNPGVAPGADLIFVHVSTGDFKDDDFFGNSRRLLEAVDYIFEKATAEGKPAVVNISLGTHGGPHDGSSLVEQGFDRLLQTKGRAIVISAGNAFTRLSHAMGDLQSGKKRELIWQTSANDPTGNEMEIWYGGADELAVTLITPMGSRVGPVKLGKSTDIIRSGSPVGHIFHRRHDPNNGDNQIDILLSSALVGGDWRVELSNSGGSPTRFHAWIERDDAGQSRFAPSDNISSYTIGSISNSRSTIAVGSYSALDVQKRLSSFSSAGPTRDGRNKPEVIAPGQDILAARSLSDGTTRMSGTSMAAPHVTGLAALVLQVTDGDVTVEELRAAILDNSRGATAAGTWDARFGFGRVSASRTLEKIITTGATPVATAIACGDGHSKSREKSVYQQPVPAMSQSAGFVFSSGLMNDNCSDSAASEWQSGDGNDERDTGSGGRGLMFHDVGYSESAANCPVLIESFSASAVDTVEDQSLFALSTGVEDFASNASDFTDAVTGYETNKFDLKADQERGWTAVAWSDDITETDVARGLVSAGVSVYTANPAPFLAWVEHLVERTISSLGQSARDRFPRAIMGQVRSLAADTIRAAIQGQSAREVLRNYDTVDFKAGAIRYSGRNWIDVPFRGRQTVSRTWGMKPSLL